MISAQARSLSSALRAWLQSASDSASAACAVTHRQQPASTIRAPMAPSSYAPPVDVRPCLLQGSDGRKRNDACLRTKDRRADLHPSSASDPLCLDLYCSRRHGRVGMALMEINFGTRFPSRYCRAATRSEPHHRRRRRPQDLLRRGNLGMCRLPPSPPRHSHLGSVLPSVAPRVCVSSCDAPPAMSGPLRPLRAIAGGRSWSPYLSPRTEP